MLGWIVLYTIPILYSILEASLVHITRGPSHGPSPMHFKVFPLTMIDLSLAPINCAKTLSFILDILAVINVPIIPNILSIAVPVIILVHSIVDIPVPIFVSIFAIEIEQVFQAFVYLAGMNHVINTKPNEDC